MSNRDRFDSNIREIEKEIINYLLKSIISSARGTITSTILFYFITRKDLTQSELKDLTQYSVGKISQEIKNFVDLGVIQVSKRSKPRIYSMESIMAETFSRAINLLKINIKWEPKLLGIKEELEIKKQELLNLDGYENIKNIVEENLFRISGYKKVVNLWEDLKKKYEKNS
jgi:DNA-binding transcriptional regulator GbsR (MarR family)